ncbi:nose resistant to fluoxetine protein 6-like isoform X2 [Sitophilus oryzae]|uniref:Nose resistant to fluoxetine protein 6-like isoform X2 n=1 Tax=Sitophilus oryzae TaxID=7048 RepID=A0A6J2Y0Q9_SITOR|nr:nose resistant to fluoxetine protein 6-like isoform X2 [Sitophilus oryzae]
MKISLDYVVFYLVFLVSKVNSITDIDVPSFQNVLESVKSSNNDLKVNLRCYEQLVYLADHPEDALKMADAWSKVHSGLLVASSIDLGDWDECMSIDINQENGFKLLGKHCVGGLILLINETLLAQSICIPNECTAEDLINLTSIPTFYDDKCSLNTDNTTLDKGAIISLLIFCSIGHLILLSTIYDVYLYLKNSKPYHSILVAFSLYTNGKKLFKTTKHAHQQILCFHGIKGISMMWIIAGHGAVGLTELPLFNVAMGKNWMYYGYSHYITSAHLAVDSFFFISGFLLAYSYFKGQYKKSVLGQISSVPHMILHRYLRLTPALLMLFLYVAFLSRYVGEGPVFNYNLKSLNIPCHKYWWSLFLYVQNYYNREELCMTQLWYVSADMQLYLIAPLILIPIAVIYKKSPKIAFISMLVLDALFVAAAIYVKLQFKDYDPNLDEYDTHSRLGDYFIGFTFGIFVRHNRQNFKKLPERLNFMIWCVVLVIMYLCVYLYHMSFRSTHYNDRAIGFCLTRTFWCICLCWLVFSCLNGQGGIINWILSNGFMQVLGKLTYCLYLVHGSVMVPYYLSVRGLTYLSDYNAFYLWCGHFLTSLLVGTLWSLSFESPMITLEKIIFSNKML